VAEESWPSSQHMPLERSDLDASAAKAKSLGGNVMVGPQNIPDGARFVILQDPQKAVFALYQPAR